MCTRFKRLPDLSEESPEPNLPARFAAFKSLTKFSYSYREFILLDQGSWVDQDSWSERRDLVYAFLNSPIWRAFGKNLSGFVSASPDPSQKLREKVQKKLFLFFNQFFTNSDLQNLKFQVLDPFELFEKFGRQAA